MLCKAFGLSVCGSTAGNISHERLQPNNHGLHVGSSHISAGPSSNSSQRFLPFRSASLMVLPCRAFCSSSGVMPCMTSATQHSC